MGMVEESEACLGCKEFDHTMTCLSGVAWPGRKVPVMMSFDNLESCQTPHHGWLMTSSWSTSVLGKCNPVDFCLVYGLMGNGVSFIPADLCPSTRYGFPLSECGSLVFSKLVDS